jgi:ATP-binding cassette, subfamily B, bacterial
VTTFGAVARRSGGWLGVFAVTALVGTLTSLAFPAVLGHAVDALVAGGGSGRWIGLAGALVLTAIVADLLGAYAVPAARADATAWTRERFVRHILAVSPVHSGRFHGGDLVSRLSAGASEAAQAGPGAVGAAVAVLPPIGSLALLCYIDVRLALAFAAGITLCTLVLRAFARRTTEATTGYQHVQGRIAAMLGEALAGRRTIAAAGTADREERRILEPLGALHERGRRTWVVLARSIAEAGIAGQFVVVSVLATGGVLLARGDISPGELFAASQYAILGAGLGSLTGAVAQLARARAGVHRLADVFADPPVPYGDTAVPDGPGRLELRGVTVRVGDAILLDAVDLDVPGRSAVALVGRSGAGKSTLAAVAARLREPDEGEVLLDGVPLRQLRHDALREAIGWAFERPVLVGATIASAIGPHLDRDRVRAAARATHADQFVSRLPEGYDTPLAGAPFSGGEVQRLGLARAWSASRLLILDDATSSLDTVTEMQIGRTLIRDRGDRTRLIITHRAATAARADAVVWLDGGRVRAVGPHAVLWHHPDYRDLFAAAHDPATQYRATQYRATQYRAGAG